MSDQQQPQQQPGPTPKAANPEAPGANPEVGIGDLFKILSIVEQAVLTGQTETPVVHLRIAGKQLDWGPAPLKIR